MFKTHAFTIEWNLERQRTKGLRVLTMHTQKDAPDHHRKCRP